MKGGAGILASLLFVVGVLSAPAMAQGAEAPEIDNPPLWDVDQILDSNSLTVTVSEPGVVIVVAQRFFNPAGNEQVGLRIETELVVAAEDSYLVPDAGDAYENVDCAALAVEDDVIAWGQGTFQAEESGTHIACYQQIAPFPGGPGQPRAARPEVLPHQLVRAEAAAPSLLVLAGLCGLFGIGLLRRLGSDTGSLT